MIKPKIVYGILGLSIIATACMPDWDLDKFDDIKYEADWSAPIFKTQVSIENIVIEDSNFTVDPDGGIRIIYEQDSIAAFGIADFTEIPTQSPTQVDLALDIPTISVATSLGTIGGAQFHSVELDSGFITLNFNNSTSFSPQIQLTFDNGELNGSVFTINHTIVPGVTSTSIDISGLLLDMTNNNTTSNYLSITFGIISNDGAPTGTMIPLEMLFEGLKIRSASGYFGDRLINIPSGSFKLGLSGIEKFINGLYLDNPTIDLVFASNIGIPLGLNMDLDGINSVGNLEPLGLPSYLIPGPSSQGVFDTTHIVVDRNNSNIVDFIANVPSNILYSGSLKMNPNGSAQNFVTSDGQVNLGLKLDLPLELRTQNLVFEQDINDFSIDLGEEQIDPFKALNLKFKVDNGFPFDASMKLVFIDKDTKLRSDSVEFNLFESAPVDASGRVTESRVSYEEVDLDTEKINHLLNANKLKLYLTLNTFNNGTQTVKLYTDYTIQVRMAAGVSVNYKP